MKEFEHTFYGSTLVGRIPDTSEVDIPVSFIDKDSSAAWSKVYRYDSSVGILARDSGSLFDMTSFYQKKSHKGTNAGISILNFIIMFLGGVEAAVKSFLGMFWGFGLIGILVVFMFLLLSIVVSIYIFAIVAPIFLAVTVLRWKINKKRKDEHLLLEACVMRQFLSND